MWSRETLILLCLLLGSSEAIKCWDCLKMHYDFASSNFTEAEQNMVIQGAPWKIIEQCPDDDQSDHFETATCEGQCVTFLARGTVSMSVGGPAKTVDTESFTRKCAENSTIPEAVWGTSSTTDVAAMQEFTITSAGAFANLVTITVTSGDIEFCTTDYCNGPEYKEKTTGRGAALMTTNMGLLICMAMLRYLL